MRSRYSWLFNVLMGALLACCVQPYVLPDLGSNQKNVLVVNSFLNTGKDTLIVKLSRTKPIGAAGGVITEGNATVTLEDDAGTVLNVPQRVKGEYYLKNIPHNPNRHYKLKIRTSDQKEYQSTLVTPRVAPALDSVTWSRTDTEVDIFVNSHGLPDGTRYYRWDYIDTYEYASAWQSSYIWDKVAKQVTVRTNANQIYHCWKTTPAQNINVGSTIQLSQDVVRMELMRIPSTSQKIIFGYSLLVYQYSVDKAEFEYWSNVKKLSETQGSLFDPQPADVIGNLTCTSDPSLRVIGYFSAGTVTEKRIFISAADLPRLWKHITDYDPCYAAYPVLDFIPNNPTALSRFTGLLISEACDPALPVCDMSMGIPGYSSASTSCIDCTVLLKGKTTKPSFWP